MFTAKAHGQTVQITRGDSKIANVPVNVIPHLIEQLQAAATEIVEDNLEQAQQAQARANELLASLATPTPTPQRAAA